MVDDKKTLKFQMMMSPGEAEILDEWMFANRVRSRAEAIRRLCQMALSQEAKLDQMKSLVDWSQGWAEEAISSLTAEKRSNSAPEILKYMETAAGVNSIVSSMIDQMKSGEDLPELPKLPEPGSFVIEEDTTKILEQLGALGKRVIRPRQRK